MTPPPRRHLTEGIRLFCETHGLCEAGVVQAPDVISRPEDGIRSPHAIIFPMPGATFQGPFFDDPEAIVEWRYQVTCVGFRHDQAARVDDLIRERFLARDEGGHFVYPLLAVQVDVLDRQLDDAGGDVPNDGSLVAVQSTYVLKVARP